VYYNTGHGHLGWTLSAATAQMIAAQVAGPAGTQIATTMPSKLRQTEPV
jgi:D-amino-acid dehydrogenase